MTTRPHLKTGRHLLPGVVAVALFAVLAYVFWFAPFTGRDGFPRGFPASESITENIGYLMFNLGDLATIDGEGFLVTFIVIAVVLDAALEGGVFLAKRESEGSLVTALRSERGARTDGGTVETDGGRDAGEGGSGGPTGESDGSAGESADPAGRSDGSAGASDGGTDGRGGDR